MASQGKGFMSGLLAVGSSLPAWFWRWRRGRPRPSGSSCRWTELDRRRQRGRRGDSRQLRPHGGRAGADQPGHSRPLPTWTTTRPTNFSLR